MKERRHEPRVKAMTLVEVGEFSPVGVLQDLTMGRTLDLSGDGMRLELDHPIPVETLLTIDLEMGEQIVEMRGRVRSVNPAEEERRWAMGIKFFALDSEDYEKIEEYVQLRS